MHLQTYIYVFKYWEKIQAESQDWGSLLLRQKEARKEGNYIKLFIAWSKLSFLFVSQWTGILLRVCFLSGACTNHYTNARYLCRKKEIIETQRMFCFWIKFEVVFTFFFLLWCRVSNYLLLLGATHIDTFPFFSIDH